MAKEDPQFTCALLAALMAMRGTIFLYQGDELGLPDAHVPFDKLQDPFAIAAYEGGPGRDGARTPMPWKDVAPVAGFTTAGQSWLPVDPAHLPLAIDRQEADPDSMLAFTRRLIAARKTSPALRTGAATPLAAPGNVLAFQRLLEGEVVNCYFELGGGLARIEGLSGVQPLWLEGGAAIGEGGLDLPPYASAIVRM
jgi:alpha-glucosidase